MTHDRAALQPMWHVPCVETWNKVFEHYSSLFDRAHVRMHHILPFWS